MTVFNAFKFEKKNKKVEYYPWKPAENFNLLEMVKFSADTFYPHLM